MRNLYLKRLPVSLFTILWLLFFLPSLSSYSQTTNISGVVNSYYSVLAVDPVRDGVKLNTVAGLAAQDKVLLIQMRGADINTAISSTTGYGDTTALNDAGNYEIHTVCAIRHDSAFFVNDILNNYTISGKVQLVKFGQYVNANVNGVLTGNTWNNSTGTGGVIALFVEQDLTLNSIITADSRGFAGGAQMLSGTGCSNSHNLTAYNGNTASPFTQNGAMKGESIAVDRPAGESGGRGARANGGGGGNDHNNSGGGGANLVRGGIGGGNSGLSSCRAAFQGEGGKALSNWGGTKIFLGGGGGAGHRNYAPSLSYGAPGGGIIFIHAANITGNGFVITSSGGHGGDSQSDGAGGGGGGGTIIMDVASYTGSLNLFAEGGHGGDSYDGGNIALCFGGGGGGGGGAIYFSGATPPVVISANGGAAGQEISRDNPSCAPIVAAGSGLTGVITPNYSFRASSTLAATCTDILPVRPGFFNADVVEKKVALQWQIFNPEEASSFTVERMNRYGEWVSLLILSAKDGQTVYQAEDNDPDGGYNSYRIRVNEKNGAILYTAVRKVFVGVTIENFSIFPNPAKDKITVKGNFDATAFIQLTDAAGKTFLTLRAGSSNTTEIKLPSLSAGIYMLHINNSVEKLVIR